MQNLRTLSPRKHDRIMELIQQEPIRDKSFVIRAIDVLQMIQELFKKDMTGAGERFDRFLSVTENHVLKTNGFNMIIRNIPGTADLQGTGEQTKVRYCHIRDTFKQVGTIELFRIIRGTVYIKFLKSSTSTRAHELTNNMMMGQNILQTEVVA